MLDLPTSGHGKCLWADPFPKWQSCHAVTSPRPFILRNQLSEIATPWKLLNVCHKCRVSSMGGSLTFGKTRVNMRTLACVPTTTHHNLCFHGVLPPCFHGVRPPYACGWVCNWLAVWISLPVWPLKVCLPATPHWTTDSVLEVVYKPNPTGRPIIDHYRVRSCNFL